VRVEFCRRRPKWAGEDDRISYQNRYVNFDIKPGESVLDIGSGGYPFPYATVLADLFLGDSKHRHEPLRTDNKVFVQADISELPFADKSFDFVYCSHVLEHVDDPIRACREIIRVGKRGYIETPTFGKDVLFAWAKDMHKWHVVAIGRNLCFFEYSQRQEEGIKSSAWRDLIFRKWYHPLQEVFYENQDIFNVMFSWSDKFAVFVFRLDGSVETLNAEVR
jgi:SAM-dependent methyltransferase